MKEEKDNQIQIRIVKLNEELDAIQLEYNHSSAKSIRIEKTEDGIKIISQIVLEFLTND